MNRTAVNASLVVAACLVYLGLAAISGRTMMNGGLGPDGPTYAAMAVDRDLQAAPAVKKLQPAFSLAVAVAYRVLGNVAASFVAVNVVAFVLLVLAACLLLDQAAAPLGLKLATVGTLCVLGLPSRVSAFDPGQPQLLGAAMLALAIAATESSNAVLAGILQIGATLASPVGIVAPVYGLWRDRRIRRPVWAALVYLPAVLAWVAVQYWARGGAAGLIDLMRFSRVRADATFWSEPAFILYGVYFLVTSLGGLTLLLWADPKWTRNAISARPELLALILLVLPFLVAGGLEVPWVVPYLLPLWLVLLGAWARDHAARLTTPLLLASLLTLLTQHPWTRITDTSYFVDWFPYSVAAGRVGVTEPAFDAIWRMRILYAATGLVAFVAVRRSLARP